MILVRQHHEIANRASPVRFGVPLGPRFRGDDDGFAGMRVGGLATRMGGRPDAGDRVRLAPTLRSGQALGCRVGRYAPFSQ